MELFKVGDTWLLLTIAFYHCGQIKAVNGDFILLEKGSQRIEDSGAVANALKTNKFDRSEVISEEVIINAQSLTSCYRWPHKLPKAQA